MEQQVEFKSELSEKHKLFETLAGNPPRWWSVVKNHPELYIEIRKGNYINIYYKGGSIAKVEYDNQAERISVVAHPKYLGQTEQKGRPIYRECGDWLEDRLDEMLSNVDKHYNSTEKQEQARMILSNRTLYIDSEFEHLYKRRKNTDPDIGKKYINDFMRIDLVELHNNTIRFVELKMIGDSRLLKKGENDSPEIYEQMQKYRNFAAKFRNEIVDYYRTLYAIKKTLGLPVCEDMDTTALTIAPKPVLVIADNYDRKTPGRTHRIKRINEKMAQKSNVFDFVPLAVENHANNHS